MKRVTFISAICFAFILMNSANIIAQSTNERITFGNNSTVSVDTADMRNKAPQLRTNVLTSDTSQIKRAQNSITIQPLGLFLPVSNIEYDMAISDEISIGGKIDFTTFLLRNAVRNFIQGENDQEAVRSLTSFGIGCHLRCYTGGRAIEGFFYGGAIDAIFFSYNKLSSNNGNIAYYPGSLWRFEYEIGARNKLSDGPVGLAMQWTVGFGTGLLFAEGGSNLIAVISLGLGIGYVF